MNWKDTIPFIPVEAGVPVIPVVAGCGNKPVVCIGIARGGQNIKVMTKKDGPLTTKATNWRVNLESPLGFMYALMWLYREHASNCYWEPLFGGRVDVMRGDYGGADMGELASAMKKITDKRDGIGNQQWPTTGSEESFRKLSVEQMLKAGFDPDSASWSEFEAFVDKGNEEDAAGSAS